MRRREFITLLAGATAWPLAARAQQPTIPVIGLLSPRSSDDVPQHMAAIRQGLKDSGYVEDQNVRIEYRFAEHQNERLASLAADLVQRRVTVIIATAAPAVVAARAATTNIPIIFEMGDNPVRLGIVASLDRPGGNITGITQLHREVAPKRLELLHELLPTVNVMALLANPTDTSSAILSNNTMSVARALGLELHVLNASTERDLNGVFAKLAETPGTPLVIGTDALFASQSETLAHLGLQYLVPTSFEIREFAAAGGLMSYGSSAKESFHQVGIYVGRILRGEKPTDLPVQQPTKFELVINMKTAKALGIDVPATLLARADEVIE